MRMMAASLDFSTIGSQWPGDPLDDNPGKCTRDNNRDLARLLRLCGGRRLSGVHANGMPGEV